MRPGGPEERIPGHSVQTVTEAGWRTTEDESLLAFAERRFDVFVTVDRKLEKQVDLTRFNVGFVIIRVRSNRLEAFDPVSQDMVRAVEHVRRGQVMHVGV